MRKRSGGGGGGGFEACDTSGDVLDEIVTSAKAFGFGRFGGPGRRTSVDMESTMSRGNGGWTRKKCGKDVVAVVKGG